MAILQIVGKTCTADQVLDWLRADYKSGTVVGLDLETEGIDPSKVTAFVGNGEIACWSLFTSGYRVFLWAEELPKFSPWLASSAPKVGHNVFNFDRPMLQHAGYELNGVAGCTLDMSRLLYNSSLRQHGLKPLALNRLGIKQPAMTTLFTRPSHRMEHRQEVKRSKGTVTNLDYRAAKRKVGETKGVPTLFASGERGLLNWGKRDFIPLRDIPTLYPDRLQALYDYASLDAELTWLLYYDFMKELSSEEWKIFL